MALYYEYRYLDKNGDVQSRKFFPGECLADYETEKALESIKGILASRGETYVDGSIERVPYECDLDSTYYDAYESYIKSLR